MSIDIIEQNSKTINLGDLTFPVVDYGSGQTVLLLHGFPDSRYLWRYQIPALADAGFRVVAPDMRGFGEASKPAHVSDYGIQNVIGDLIGILDTLDIESAMLVGHDWGAVPAYSLTAYFPQRIQKLILMSVGCLPNSGWEAFKQRERSWYMDFFRKEGIAEEWIQYDNWKFFRDWTRGDGDYTRYINDLSRPGALTAGLNWYRANGNTGSPPIQPLSPRITCPVLGLWSDGDYYLIEEQMLQSYENIDAEWQYRKIRGASHWFMLERPDLVNRYMIEFLSDHTD